MKYTANQIKQWSSLKRVNGKWIPCRSLNSRVESIYDRIVNALLVLFGKYDALDWEQPK